MTNRKLNRKLHEAFGHCWHELEPIPVEEWDAEPHFFKCKKCGYETDDCQEECNPDYVADPRLVIREMEAARKFPQFMRYLCFGEGICSTVEIAELIAIDTTGKLARLALEWLKGERNGNSARKYQRINF